MNFSSRYNIIREIGHGGTGVIYLAYDRSLCKNMVIKKVASTVTGNLRREVDILKGLHYPGLPQVYDFFEADGAVWTVMDYIEGHDLEYFVKKRRQIPEQLLRSWFSSLSDILQYLHTRQVPVLHSDIKPGNIMLTADGEIYLIDFNISLNGGHGVIRGLSAFYAAPEQYQEAMNLQNTGSAGDVTVDARMDIYSLCASFYTLMTGRRPAPAGRETVPLAMMDLPYSTAFCSLIDKGMNRNPRRRFQTSGEMLRAIQRLERSDPKYRRLTMLQIFMILPLAVMLTVSVVMIAVGHARKLDAAFKNELTAYRKLSESGDDQGAIEAGQIILNNSEYEDYLEDHPEQKAGLLYEMGCNALNESQYTYAADCYREASELDETPEYYRDLAVALARSGSLSEAEQALGKAKASGLSEMTGRYLDAELAYGKKDTETAAALLNRILSEHPDADTAVRSSLLLAEIYESEGNMEEARQAVCSGLALVSDRDLMRRVAGLDLMMAQQNNHAGSYLSEAKAYYSRLCGYADASYQDRMNYALCLRAGAEYEESRQILEQMEQDYPEDCRCMMWLSYNFLDLYRQYGDIKMYDRARSYYEKCMASYRAARDAELNSDLSELGIRIQA